MMDLRTQRFHDAVARVQKYDKEFFIGVCSTQNIERLERHADELEARANVVYVNEPLTQATQVLADLHQRGLKARASVLEWQAEIRKHARELSIVGMPAGHLDEPPLVPGTMPMISTAPECEAYNAEFAQTVTKLEMKATQLKNYLQGWTRLTNEQQNRELIMALAKRILN